jgi:hypothetical protein
MHIGHYISGGAHAGLIFWALFGGMFAPEPLPMEVATVSVITSAEFDAITAAYQPPSIDMAAQDLTQTPTTETAPILETAKDETVSSVIPPARPEQTVEITKPQPVEPLETPQVEPAIPDQPAPPQEVTPDLPVTRPNAVPRPADRVAPEPVAPPKEDAAIDEQVQDSVALADAGQKTDQPEQEATAPEAATTEIVTEAKKEPPSGAPKTSPRPRQRPAEPQVEKTDPAPPETQKSDPSSVQDALAQAMAGTTSEPSGPPMTQGETDAFRISVQKCWVVDVGSEAANVTVTVAMSLDRDGMVDGGSLKLISSTGGSDRAANTAFNAARRAILRCQKDGYKLPVDKYDHWRDIEITFNPEEMRAR